MVPNGQQRHMNPSRYPTGYWERQDAEVDSYFSCGSYKLPKKIEGGQASLEYWAISVISRHRLAINNLPKILRSKVNKYHAEYTVGTVVKESWFRTKCHTCEQADPVNCRRCQWRQEAWELHRLGVSEKSGNWYTTTARGTDTGCTE